MADPSRTVWAVLMAIAVTAAGVVGVGLLSTPALAATDARLDASTSWANGNDLSGQSLTFTLPSFQTGTVECTYDTSAARAEGVVPQSVEVSGSDRLEISLTNAGNIKLTIQSGAEEQVQVTFYGNLEDAGEATDLNYALQDGTCTASFSAASGVSDPIEVQQSGFDIVETGIKDTNETHVHSDGSSIQNGSTLTQSVDLDLVVPDDGDSDGDTYNVTIDTQDSLANGINVTGATVESDPSGANAQVEVVGTPTVTDDENVTITIREGTDDRDDGNLSRETITIGLDLDATQEQAGAFVSNTTVTHVIDDEVGNETARVTYDTAARSLSADAGAIQTVNVSEAFELNASASSADGSIVSFEWDVDDDGTFELTGETVTHNFSEAGEKTVTLRITDDAGNNDTDTVTITVEAADGNETDDNESDADTKGPSGAPPDRFAAFSDTRSIPGNQADPSSLGGKIRVESDLRDATSIELLRNSSGNYSLAITVTQNATNVTFYLQQQAVEASQDIDNVTMYLDGERRDFYVDESAGPGNSPWIAFEVDHFSTRTVSFVSDNETETNATQAPDVSGDGRAAQDRDGDGAFEDIDGDGEFGIVDVQVLFTERQSDAVQNNAEQFDFNADGRFSISDVQRLFTMLQEQ